jgi:hypothetical protein
MSADQPIEVELTVAVVSFDGRVLEVFGGRDADRVHVAQITSIEQDKNTYVIDTVNQVQHTIIINDSDEAKRGDIESLLDTVGRASPNLEEGK